MPSVFSSVLLQRFPNGLTLLSMLAEILFHSCLRYLAVARRFMRLVLCWVAAPLICNLGYGGLSFDAGGDAG